MSVINWSSPDKTPCIATACLRVFIFVILRSVIGYEFKCITSDRIPVLTPACYEQRTLIEVVRGSQKGNVQQQFRRDGTKYDFEKR